MALRVGIKILESGRYAKLPLKRLIITNFSVVKVPGSDGNFTVAKYKQELAKPYSKVVLFICKESDFKKDKLCNNEVR